MKGKILDFNIQDSAGVISGDDGQRYNFSSSEWKSDVSPAKNQIIDFSIDGENATSIYLEKSNDLKSMYSASNIKINPRQIGGIALMIVGVLIFSNAIENILDLINAANNPLVQYGLQMQGTSLGMYWIKYGVISLVGIIMTFYGFKIFKSSKA